jgi:uncharacterized membrane protein (UPF0136 family)
LSVLRNIYAIAGKLTFMGRQIIGIQLAENGSYDLIAQIILRSFAKGYIRKRIKKKGLKNIQKM